MEKIVTRFLQNGVTPAQIGVITPYEGQRAHIMAVMGRTGTLRSDLYADIEVSSVDAFQVRLIMRCCLCYGAWKRPVLATSFDHALLHQLRRSIALPHAIASCFCFAA